MLLLLLLLLVVVVVVVMVLFSFTTIGAFDCTFNNYYYFHLRTNGNQQQHQWFDDGCARTSDMSNTVHGNITLMRHDFVLTYL